MAWIDNWDGELRAWLAPFLEKLGHKARRRMCPLYVAGLIGPGDRKSIQPMAERLAPGDYDQLHHFVAAGVWDAEPLETELLRQANHFVGQQRSAGDDTAIPKKDTHSVGVAAQYASALGKTANCQTLVSATLARDEVPVTVALRLFLPESWTSDPARLRQADVPAEYREARTKPEIALAEIDRVSAPARPAGSSPTNSNQAVGFHLNFRTWAVGIPRHLKVYPVDVRLIWPRAHPGRSIDPRGEDARRSRLANHQLAHRHERKAQGLVCRRPSAHCRRPAATDRRQRPATSSRRGSLADW